VYKKNIVPLHERFTHNNQYYIKKYASIIQKDTIMEIERKFLVNGDSYKQLAAACVHIRQGYISREKSATVRVRIADNTAFLTIKGKPTEGHFARYEWEKEIAVTDAEELLNLCQGTIIDKTRWIVPANEEGLKWEVDEFHHPHQGLTIAEIELVSEDQKFVLPDFIGTEVTNDSQYYNANM
jgi:adenylate cyclase